MSKFFYTAKNSLTGETSGGEMEAQDEKSLAADLRASGLLLTSSREEVIASGIQIKFFDRFRRVPLKEKMTFTRNLAVMVSSGLTVSRAVHNLSLQTKNKVFKEILDSVNDDLQSGKTLSEGFGRYPTVFNELFVNMLYVGEVSGNLEEVLEILALQLEKENDLLSKVRGALIYPAVIVVAMIGIAILMLVYILPKITGVFKDLNVELPATTQVIMAISDFMINHSFITIGLSVILVVGTKIFAGTVPGKRFFGFVFVRLPIIGNIVIKVNCARFSRIYSSLLKSGISVVNALTIVSKTLANPYYKDAFAEAIAGVQKGEELSKIIGKYPVIFPLLVPQILEVGEETGKTEAVLQRLAEFYEEEVSQITKNMSSIIEPILMLFIGGGVGFFAVAMLQPMYSVLGSIK
ncbi:MAG: type II secretion system F family protein [Candidatus Moranbacteria bacterium]|nr:type II secretion system F family protein [Candidatus Moranbacteria bacterium]